MKTILAQSRHLGSFLLLLLICVSSPSRGWCVEPVIAPDDGAGTVSFPVLGAPFTNGTRVRKGMQELKNLAQDIRVEVQSIKNNSVTSSGAGGGLGGGQQVCSGTAVVVAETPGGFRRELSVPVTITTDTAPGSPGSEDQSFATGMVRLEGEIFGDPDFDLLRVTGGSDFGLPSPGHTTLTRLGPPGSNFAVDSFFDIAYQIEFLGASGGALDGLAGVRTENARCEQPLRISNGVVYETTGATTAVRTPDGLRVSGGGGAIRLASESLSLNFAEIKWTYQKGAASNGLELPNEGDTLTLGVHVRELDKSSTKLCESVCSTTGGTTSCTMDFSSLGATGARVEVWHLGQLVGSAVAPNGTAAFSVPVRDFQLQQVRVHQPGGAATGAARRRGDTTLGDVVVVKELDKSSPKLCTIPGPPGGPDLTLPGSELRLYPVGAQLRVGAIGHVDHACTTACVIDDNSVRIFDREVRALGDAGLSKADAKRALERLKISNLGSSGEDGVSVDLGDDGAPPVRIELEELQLESTGPTVTLGARDAFGNPLGGMRTTGGGGGGGGAGGRVLLADFSPISSPTALVRVFQDDTLVGETQVTLSGETQVAEISDGPDGAPLLRACGKNEQLPPFQLPCFFAEFDRTTVVTPAGSPTGLSGNRVEVLADGASGSPNPLRFFELRAGGSRPLFVSGIHHEPGDLSTWIWDPLSPPLPPLVRIVSGTPARFDTSAGAGLPAGSEGLEFRVQIRDLVDLGPAPTGSGNLFDCTVEISASGLAGKKGYDYYKTLSAVCVIDTGSNPFDGEDVQQFDIEMLSMDLSIPLPDPDFSVLTVRCGADLGLPPCPGRITRSRLPGGDFVVDSFFDITYEISFQGAPGGPLAGVAGTDTFTSRWLMYQSQFIRWGLVHEELGSADLSRSPTGSLRISNLGSSGCDGVSIALGGAQGGTIEFEPHTMLPGASFRCETVGDAAGRPVSSPLGHVQVTRAAQPDSFFDIFYDLSFGGGSETCVQVLHNGAVVSETVVWAATGALRLDPTVPGADPPPVRACGKLPGLGGPSCYFVVFGASGTITPPGGAPVEGDEVRMLELEVRVNRLEMARCFFTDDNPWDIERSSIVMHGRNVLAEDGSLVSCWDGSCRVCIPSSPSSLPFRCIDGSSAISAAACPDSPATAGPLTLRITPRDAASGLPTGKRQHKPLSVSVSGLLLASPGQSLHVQMTGTAGGAPNQTIGELEVSHSGGQVLTSVQWPFKFSAQTRVLILENPLYQESGDTGSNPLYEGVASAGTAPVTIDASAPVLIEACCGAPGDDNPLNRPAYMCVSFANPLSVTAPDGLPYQCREVVFIPEDPALPPVSDIQALTLSGVGNACYDITSAFTGPVWYTGLSHLSLGSCTLETDASDRLVVSNIGSSGLDGVSIDLQQGQGARIECEPCPITLPDAELRCTPIRLGTVDFDRDGVCDLVVSSNNDDSSCWIRVGRNVGSPRVVCRDSFGNVVGDYTLPFDDIGVCSPGGGGGAVRVTACGWTPRLLTSLGNTDPGPFLEFSEPVTFAPSTGASVECRSLQIHCPDEACAQYRATDYQFACRFANLPDQPLVTCHVCHLVCAPHSGLGEARLRADAGPDTLTISNIGSSGEDGVSIDLGRSSSFSTGGSGGEDRLTENVTLNFTRVEVEYNRTTPGGSRIELRATGSFDPNGGPPVPLGVCSLDLDSDNDSVPLRSDFSSLGAVQSRVVVLQDGELVGQFVHGDPTPPVIVGRVRQAGPTPPGLNGCGKLRSEQIPGGWQPPCFFWTFDGQVEVTPPGGAAGSGFTGNEVRVLAEGAIVPQVAGLYEFELRVTDNTGLSPLTLTGIPRNDFPHWLTLHFSEAEIDQLAAEQFLGDFDKDGCPDICEFVNGTDPRVPDSSPSESLSSSVVTDGGGQQHMRLTYVTAGADSFEIVLRSSANLRLWNTDASQFRLIERLELPDGERTRWTWEVVSPMGSKTREFYGHVTILK